MIQNTPTVPVPVSAFQELAAFGRALTKFAEKFSQVDAKGTPVVTLSDEAFEQETKAMRQAFSDLSEEQLTALIDEAVQAARRSSKPA